MFLKHYNIGYFYKSNCDVQRHRALCEYGAIEMVYSIIIYQVIAELQPTAGNGLMSAPDDDKIVQTISMPVTIVSPGEGAVTYEQETGVTDVQTAYAQTSEATTALLYLTNYQSY